jgi:oligopeptide/dipeptide ABC transporter ATP-binding protein
MTLLRTEDLTVHYRVRRGLTRKAVDVVHAADAVNIALDKGQTLALVGESGCGKTTVAMAVLGLAKITAGSVVFDGRDVTGLRGKKRREVARRMQVVFQDPYSSLDPRMTVHDIVSEPLTTDRSMTAAERSERVQSLLERVALGTQHLWRRPHEFSGGQCQRIAIARALALSPDFIVLDEPTSALDVSVQARILILLKELQASLGLAYLFIAHDLAVVEAVADQVAVMYLGRIVEKGSAATVFAQPLHPYTVALLESIPSPDPERRSLGPELTGEVPSAVNPPRGCRFHPRCSFRMHECESVEPVMRRVGDHEVACHLQLPRASTLEGA